MVAIGLTGDPIVSSLQVGGRRSPRSKGITLRGLLSQTVSKSLPRIAAMVVQEDNELSLESLSNMM